MSARSQHRGPARPDSRPPASPPGRRRPRTPGAWRVAALVAAVPFLAPSGPAAAQDGSPRLPSGAAGAVLPLQSAEPASGGGWPGGAGSLEATIEALNAELGFAFREVRGAASWKMPRDAVDQAAGNPHLRVDPLFLSYEGLVDPDEGPILDPLHGQLRSLSALLDARIVVLPVELWYEPLSDREEAARTTGGEAEENGNLGRAALRLAIVDARGGRVLWHGVVRGEPHARDNPGLLASLAARVAEVLSPS